MHKNDIMNESYLKNDGFAFDLRHILENSINDVEKFISLQKTGLIFFEEINEVIQDKIRS